MYDQVVKSQRAGLCLSEHFLIFIVVVLVVAVVVVAVLIRMQVWVHRPQ